jgi:hypothetical protein
MKRNTTLSQAYGDRDTVGVTRLDMSEGTSILKTLVCRSALRVNELLHIQLQKEEARRYKYLNSNVKGLAVPT